jgi:polysaccharide chain length determinant protein (PEP-CTERM system associated)
MKSMPPQDSGFQIEDALEIFDRRKWWLAIGALVGLLAGTGIFLSLPPAYTSTTSILVEPQRVPESYVRSTVTLKVKYQLNTLYQRVTAFPNLNVVIDQIGEERIDPTGLLTRNDMMGKIRRNFSVNILNDQGGAGAPVFEVSYTASDGQLAADFARVIADLYISENIKDRAQQAAATADFLDRELDRLRDEVTAQEKALRDFRRERMGALPEQLETNLRGLDRLNLQLAANLESQLAVNQRMALLKQQVGRGGSSGSGYGASSDLTNALDEARRALVRTEGIYTPEHPNVVHLRGEVKRLEKEIAEAPTDPDSSKLITDPRTLALNRELDTAALELKKLKRHEKRILEDTAKLQKNVDDTPRGEQELLALTRDYKNLTTTYHTLLGKKFEAAISRNLETAQKGQRFKMLRRANVPMSPTGPDMMVWLPGGLGAGLALVILVIAFLEIRNPVFRSVAHMTRMIGLPVFASIPRIDNDAIYETPPNGDVDPRLVIHTAPESTPAEQYRGFLPVLLGAENCQVILVTSATRGDGKTLTTMNLAASLATDLNKKVLVIDSDLRRPTAHRVLRVSRATGLSSVLNGRATLAQSAVNSKVPGLSVLPAGPLVRNPLALITGEPFLALLREARKSYDLVLIDSPPLLPVVDTHILRKMADLVVFVVRADSTPKDAVLRSLEDLSDIAGVVFNNVSPGAFRRYYYYDAYSRYAYAEEPGDTGKESS